MASSIYQQASLQRDDDNALAVLSDGGIGGCNDGDVATTQQQPSVVLPVLQSTTTTPPSLTTLLLVNGIEPEAKGGCACPFPWRIHVMLDAVERENLQHVVSWQPHGRAFIVRDPATFAKSVLPRCVFLLYLPRFFSFLIFLPSDTL